MKGFKALALAGVLFLSSLPLYSCGEGPDGGSPGGGNPDGGISGEVEKGPISSSLLDGKVANLLGAKGIGIVKKDAEEEGGAAPLSSKISAKTDEKEKKEKQDKNELAKVEEDGEIVDVRFHEGKNGSNREWNNKYGTHHHDKELCPKHNCDMPSDELLQEEQENNVPTVTQLDARVNKLYNAGEYTFMCVSAAIDGEIEIIENSYEVESAQFHAFSLINLDEFDLSMREEVGIAHWNGDMPTLINVEKYIEEEERGIFSYVKVREGEEEGIIFVKRSSDEIGYHEANYWSDGFNQSYLIDNETGKTYSLAEFPYIYSVENGIIKVFDYDGSVGELLQMGGTVIRFDYYMPKIVDGELTFEKLNEDPIDVTNGDGLLVDKYGNKVLAKGKPGYNREEGFDAYRVETLEDGTLLAEEGKGRPTGGYFRRHFKADDGLIYRLDWVAEMGDSVLPYLSCEETCVKVLNEECEWVPVSGTASVSFGKVHMFYDFYFIKIEGGYAYYSRGLNWGNGRNYYGHSKDAALLAESIPGVIKIPTQGGEDVQLQEFWSSFENEEGEEWSLQEAYRIGDNSALYYLSGFGSRRLVFWNRETDYKIEMAGSTLFIDGEYQNSCFKINYILNPTAPIEEWENQTAYVPYQGVSVSENLNEWILDEPILNLTATFEEYYEFVKSL